MKKILVIDNQPIILEGLHHVLSKKGYSVIKASTSEQASLLTEYVDDIKAIVCDITIDNRDNSDYISTLTNKRPSVPVIIYATPSNSAGLFSTLETDIAGAVLKDEDVMELFNAVEAVLKGERYFSNGIKLFMANVEQQNKCLSTRSLNILRHICAGENNRQIAHALCIGEKTVEYHRSAILRQFECKTMAGAVYRALKQGLIF